MNVAPPREAGAAPLVSIVLPTYNGARHLEAAARRVPWACGHRSTCR
jgi:hypothetical protein